MKRTLGSLVLGSVLVLGLSEKAKAQERFIENFDSYQVGSDLDGLNDWGATNVTVRDFDTGNISPNTSPNFVYFLYDGEAVWHLNAQNNINALDLEFYAELQTRSDPQVYLSSDGANWTEITDEFDLTKNCDNQISDRFDADLTDYIEPLGIQKNVYLKWTNDDPILPNCYVVGLDSITANLPEPSTLALLGLGAYAIRRKEVGGIKNEK